MRDRTNNKKRFVIIDGGGIRYEDEEEQRPRRRYSHRQMIDAGRRRRQFLAEEERKDAAVLERLANETPHRSITGHIDDVVNSISGAVMRKVRGTRDQGDWTSVPVDKGQEISRPSQETNVRDKSYQPPAYLDIEGAEELYIQINEQGKILSSIVDERNYLESTICKLKGVVDTYDAQLAKIGDDPKKLEKKFEIEGFRYQNIQHIEQLEKAKATKEQLLSDESRRFDELGKEFERLRLQYAGSTDNP